MVGFHIIVVPQHIRRRPRGRQHVGQVAHLVQFRSIQVAHRPVGCHPHPEARGEQHGRIRQAVDDGPTLHTPDDLGRRPETRGHGEQHLRLLPRRILHRGGGTGEGRRHLAPFPQQVKQALRMHLQVVIFVLVHGQRHRLRSRRLRPRRRARQDPPEPQRQSQGTQYPGPTATECSDPQTHGSSLPQGSCPTRPPAGHPGQSSERSRRSRLGGGVATPAKAGSVVPQTAVCGTGTASAAPLHWGGLNRRPPP